MPHPLPPHRSQVTEPLTDFEVKALESSDPVWAEHRLGQRMQDVKRDVETLKASDIQAHLDFILSQTLV